MNDRAKQFSAFSPLKGYNELLRKKERIIVPKIELTEDSKRELSLKLSEIKKGQMIKAIYYSKGEYLSVEGMVTRIDFCFKKLFVVKTEIDFKDIYDISVDNEIIF